MDQIWSLKIYGLKRIKSVGKRKILICGHLQTYLLIIVLWSPQAEREMKDVIALPFLYLWCIWSVPQSFGYDFTVHYLLSTG